MPAPTPIRPALGDDIEFEKLSEMTKQRNVAKTSVKREMGCDVIVAIRHSDYCVFIGVDAVAVSQFLDNTSIREVELHTREDQTYAAILAAVSNVLVAELLNTMQSQGYATAMVDGSRFRVVTPARSSQEHPS